MADLHVASTTDSIEDVRIAAGLPASGQEEEQVTDEPETQEPETEEAATREPETQEAEPDAEAEEEPERQERRPRNQVQKRIDKLTAKNYQLEEQAEQARREARELRERLEVLEKNATGADKAQPAEESAKPRPKQADFDDYDKYVDALTDWKLEQRDAKALQARQAEQQAALQARLQETYSAYNRAVSAIREEHEDYDEVVGRDDLQLPLGVMNAIVGMREDGPAVAYAIAQDEETCARLSELAIEEGDAVAVMEFGRWLGQAGGGNEAQPARRVAVPVKTKPVKPVGTSSTRSQVALDELPYQDYARIRREQEKSRFRR